MGTILFPFGKISEYTLTPDELDVVELEINNTKTFIKLTIEDDTELVLTQSPRLPEGSEVNILLEIVNIAEKALTMGGDILGAAVTGTNDLVMVELVALGGKFYQTGVIKIGNVE